MAVQLLAPAAPVSFGYSAVVRARVPASGRALTTEWHWDDGQQDRALLRPAVAYARCAHRYAQPGVYRVRVVVTPPGGAQEGSARYVTIRRPDQLAASGWVRDESSGTPVPFGFLITPRVDAAADAVVRCLLALGELRAGALDWVMGDGSASLHFGGSASLGDVVGPFRFRIDVSATTPPNGLSKQHLALSVYPPHGIPGRDSPLVRVSGPIRPGRADAPFGAKHASHRHSLAKVTPVIE